MNAFARSSAAADDWRIIVARTHPFTTITIVPHQYSNNKPRDIEDCRMRLSVFAANPSRALRRFCKPLSTVHAHAAILNLPSSGILYRGLSAATSSIAAPPRAQDSETMNGSVGGEAVPRTFLVKTKRPEPSNRSDAVAVIFGWVGSTDKLTGKYAQLAHELGIGTVLRGTAPTFDCFFRPSNLRHVAKDLMDLLAAQYPGKPVYLMYFSNGGAFVHENLLQVLREAEAAGDAKWSPVRIAGTLFDSAPAHLTITTGSRALTEGIKHPVIRRLAYAVTWTLFGVFYPLVTGPTRPRKFFEHMLADQLPCPTLYVYSDTDRITMPEPLAELVAQRAARHPLGPEGVNQLRIRAGEGASPHVSHLLKHRAKYTAAVEAFLQQCEVVMNRRAAKL